MNRKRDQEALLRARANAPDSQDVKLKDKFISKLQSLSRVLKGKARQRTSGTQSEYVIEKSADVSENNHYPTYANKVVQIIKAISENQVAFCFKDNDTNKFGVEIFSHQSTEVQHQVLPQSDTPISCITSTAAYLLIGTEEKKVNIYRVGEYAAPLSTIELISMPTELAIYSDTMCICLQANQSTES